MMTASLLCGPALTPAVAHVDPWPDARGTAVIRMGTLRLRACGVRGAWCGHVNRALDTTGAVADVVAVHFEYYRHTGRGRATGTLVATEGGPGYAATRSRDDYLALFGPLMVERDVVIMDNRGTGNSGAVECPELQSAEYWSVEAVARCGASLGMRAALYGTADAADDLAAVLAALGAGPVDLYGDSYGTYFGQVFAARHPQAVRSLVLDGAYPLAAPDYAWSPTSAPAMRAKFNLTCTRSAPCVRVPGTSIEHIRPALDALRSAPFQAAANDVDGMRREFRADASQLAIVMYGMAPALTTARETDAAAQAFVQGDRLPLLRLMAETVSAVDSRDASADAHRWSAGLAAAVMCQDPPQIFDQRLSVTARAVDLERALAERRRNDPDTYAPFSIDEYRGMPLDYSLLDLCTGWPVPPAAHPASQMGVDTTFPDVPVLVISGELDDLTTPADGAAVAAAFKHGMQIRMANSFHVNALPRGRSTCGAQIARRFLKTLTPGDISCAADIAPLRLVERFAVHSHDLEPATAMRGDAADAAGLQLAAAAVLTAGDVIARLDYNSSGRGRGLRGGRYQIAHGATGGERITLHDVRWVEDVRVNGIITRSHRHNGVVRVRLRVDGADGSRARLRTGWTEGGDAATAWISGVLSNSGLGLRGVRVTAVMAAP